MELEVVLAANETEDAGMAEARDLMNKLAIEPDALVAGAYLDLLAARSQKIDSKQQPCTKKKRSVPIYLVRPPLNCPGAGIRR